MISIFAKTPKQITEELELKKSFQGKQIYSWLVKGASTYEEMTDLPKALREELGQKYASVFSSEVAGFQTDDSGAVKLALKLYDGGIIECVLLTDKEGELTACLSCQVGCAMGCRFCRTGTLKLKRNLDAGEIIEQFMQLQRKAPDKITHIVFMGMGEPMTNLENVLKAIEFLHDPDGINMGYRRITISTCGVVTGIDELARRKVPVKLAVSLVTADDTKRSALMPVNRTFSLQALRRALVDFQKVSGRRFTFEYCMMKDENISSQDADKLSRFCKGLEVIVNLIPFNECEELPFKTPSDAQIKDFCRMLDERNIQYTVRISRGRSIKGACGQLAGKLV